MIKIIGVFSCQYIKMLSRLVRLAFPSLRILGSKYTEIRSLPRNIKEDDVHLFTDELVYRHENITAVEWNNCTLYGSDVVPLCLILPILFGFKHVSLSRLDLKLILKRLYSYLQALNNRSFLPDRARLGTLIYIHDTYSNGFFHWICDCLPKLVAAESILLEHNALLIIPNSYKLQPYVQYTLDALGISYRFGNANEIIDSRKLYVINPVARSGNFKTEHMRLIRDKMSRPKSHFDTRNKIYVSRKYSHRRFLQNEELLVDFLIDKNFMVIYPEEKCLQEQVELFSNCSLLVGLHGGGLTNMIFMPENSNVIEIRLENDTRNNCYFALSSSLGVNYYYIEAKSISKFGDVQNTDLELPISEIEKVLLEVPET